jgi:hypothetical protein
MDRPKVKWEEVANDPWTLRLPVPGGWLYCIVALTDNGKEYRNAIAFVPFAKEA